MTILAVLTPFAIDKAYSYLLPDSLADPSGTLRPGTVVRVPLGPRLVTGVVWHEAGDGVDTGKLREIEHAFDVRPLSGDMMKFIDWGRPVYAQPPRHGAAHGPARSGSTGAGTALARRAANRAGSRTYD